MVRHDWGSPFSIFCSSSLFLWLKKTWHLHTHGWVALRGIQAKLNCLLFTQGHHKLVSLSEVKAAFFFPPNNKHYLKSLLLSLGQNTRFCCSKTQRQLESFKSTASELISQLLISHTLLQASGFKEHSLNTFSQEQRTPLKPTSTALLTSPSVLPNTEFLQLLQLYVCLEFEIQLIFH